GCPNGRRFLSGTTGGGALLLRSDFCPSGLCLTNDTSRLTGWGSGAGGAIVPPNVPFDPLHPGDSLASDNTMTRLPNGDLILARDVLHQLPNLVDTEGIFRSSDCGAH